MMYQINHRTTFAYSQPVAISQHVLRLSPRVHPRQHCARSTILVEPAPSVRSERIDFFGNPMVHLTVQEPHPKLLVYASSQVEVTAPPTINLENTPPWDQVTQCLEKPYHAATMKAQQFVYDSPYITGNDVIFDFAKKCFPPGRPLLAATMALTTRIFTEFTYKGGVTDISTPVTEVLSKRKGVCQDFAHLQIACLRSLGLPARYVSGYVLTHPPTGKEKMVGADASHAWLSVWCPDVGWVDFDPTNNLIPQDEHITVAWGRDYGDVSPINGFMVGGGTHSLHVKVDVNPVDPSKVSHGNGTNIV